MGFVTFIGPAGFSTARKINISLNRLKRFMILHMHKQPTFGFRSLQHQYKKYHPHFPEKKKG